MARQATTASGNSGGIGLTGALGVLFVALKLTGQIDWSWWWVLAPFWIPAAIVGAILLVVAVLSVVVKK